MGKNPIFRNIHIKRFVKLKEYQPMESSVDGSPPRSQADLQASLHLHLVSWSTWHFRHRKCLYKQSLVCQVISINTRKNSTYQEIYFYIPWGVLVFGNCPISPATFRHFCVDFPWFSYTPFSVGYELLFRGFIYLGCQFLNSSSTQPFWPFSREEFTKKTDEMWSLVNQWGWRSKGVRRKKACVFSSS